MKRVPVYLQLRNNENTETVLRMILGSYGCFPDMQEIRRTCHEIRGLSELDKLPAAAEKFGLMTEVFNVEKNAVIDLFFKCKTPLIVTMKDNHFCIINCINRNIVRLIDPNKGSVLITSEQFLTDFGGVCMKLTPGNNFVRFGKKSTLLQMLKERTASYYSSIVKLTILQLSGIGAEIAMTFFIKRLLDNDSTRIYHEGVVLGFAIVLLLLFQIFTLATQSVLSLKYSRDAAGNFGNRAFGKLVDMHFSSFEHFSIGDLMDRMETSTILDDTILRILVPLITDAASVLVYFYLLFYYNKTLAFVCIIIEAVYLILSALLQRHISVLSNSISTSSANLSTITLRGFDTIATTKGSGAETTFYSMWRNHETAYLAARKKLQQTSELNYFLSCCHDVLIDGAILFIGAVFIIRGQFTLSALASVQIMVRHIEGKMKNAVNYSDQLNQCSASLEKSSDLLNDAAPKTSEGYITDKPVSGDLVVNDVSFIYPGRRRLILDRVSFRVAEGELVALVGHTGCGKSTLLKVLQGMYQPMQGTVTYGGMKKSEMSEMAFRTSIISMNQETAVFHDTVRDNMTMWNDAICDDDLCKAAIETDIHNRIIIDEKGYSNVLNPRGTGFSGGELQRMEYAGALSHNPSFFLLDEFTSAQDAYHEANALEILKQKRITCLMAAHRISTVVKADRIIVMDKGRIVEQGTHEELYASGKLYRKLIDMGKC